MKRHEAGRWTIRVKAATPEPLGLAAGFVVTFKQAGSISV